MNGGVISGMHTTGNGGGVHIDSGGIFTMNNGIIHNNSAFSGGGVSPGFGGNFHMNGGIIIGNTATFNPGMGGAGNSTLNGGILFNGNNGTLHGTIVLDDDFTIPDNYTLTIQPGATLTIPPGTTLTNDGTVINNGTIVNDGTFNRNVTFDPNSGTLTVLGEATRTINHGAEVGTLPQVTRDGFTFDGWFNTSAATGGTQWQATTEVTADVTLYARWTAITHTVAFNLDSGSYAGNQALLSQTINYGQNATALTQDPTRTGFTFAGWTPTLDLTNVTANRTFTAQWIATDNAVTFNTHGGTTIPAQNVPTGQTATRPANDPTRTGYNFVNWFTAQTGGVLFDFTAPITATMEIHAQWTTLPVYAVTFNTHSGTAVAPQNIQQGQLATRPTDPTRTGYTFVNWFTAQTGGAPFDFTVPITATTEIHAQWTALPVYAVAAFNTHGGTAVAQQNIQQGQTATRPADPTRTGYNFVNWFTAQTGGVAFDFTVPITADTIIHARWTVTQQPSTPDPSTPDSSTPDPSPTGAWLSNSRATFDIASPQDITINLNSGDFSFRNIRFGNVVLVRDRDFTVTNNRYTINADFLSTLELGQRRLTFEMSGGTNLTFTITVIDTEHVPTTPPQPTPDPMPQPTPDPTPQPTPDPILQIVRVELSQALRSELTEILGDAFYDLVVDIVTLAANEVNGGFVITDITFSLADEVLSNTLNNQLPHILQAPNAYFTITANLSDFIDAELNHHRITTIHNGRIIGGNLDINTGYFTVTASTTGEFTIAYIETLMRLALQIGSPTIHDLAGNAPAQFMDVVPLNQYNRTLIPIRFIAETLGAEVNWISGTSYTPSIAIILFDGQTLSIPIGEMTPELQALGMDIPAQVMGGRTMVPLRFVSEFFGAVVTWDAETQGIEIIMDSVSHTYTPAPSPNTGASHITTVAYIDRSAIEAIERVLRKYEK